MAGLEVAGVFRCVQQTLSFLPPPSCWIFLRGMFRGCRHVSPLDPRLTFFDASGVTETDGMRRGFLPQNNDFIFLIGLDFLEANSAAILVTARTE